MSSRPFLLRLLAPLGFEVGDGITPFGQELPLVRSWAIDRGTATLALFAEADAQFDEEAWRDLLFALAGLRNELRRGRDAALSTPILFALVKTNDEAKRLRGLIEELGRDYMLFTRLEINIITEPVEEADYERLLAPLLPRARRALLSNEVLGNEILVQLEEELRKEILQAGAQIDDQALVGELPAAAEEIADRVSRTVRVDPQAEQPVAVPISQLSIRDLRSFEDATLVPKAITLFEGGNGTGKSTVIEALEILWSHTSSRWPAKVTREDFARHLVRSGASSFEIQAIGGDGTPQEGVLGAQKPGLGLGRNIFLHDLSSDVALQDPSDRYSELLHIAGLEIPELKAETARLREETKDALNRVLARVGLPRLERLGNVGPKHVRRALQAKALPSLPDPRQVKTASDQVAAAARRAGFPFSLPLQLPDADGDALAGQESWRHDVQATLRVPTETVDSLRALHAALADRAAAAAAYLEPLEALVAQATSRVRTHAAERVESKPQPESQALPASAARAWLYLGNSLQEAVRSLETQTAAVGDAEWRERIEQFAARARDLLAQVPFDELLELEKQTGFGADRLSAPEPAPLDPELLSAVGFVNAEIFEPELIQAISQLRDAVRAYAGAARESAEVTLRSPLLNLVGNEDELRTTLARYEIARLIQSPIERAAETIVARLIADSFGAIVGELVSALTRFEWYFGPFEFALERGRLHLRGMATDDDRNDLRMLLNAGERSIVTLSWFMALFLLQPPERRRVLVLDDPFATLDATNQAAALATLRMFVRLTRPELLIFSCHDRMMGEGVLHEMGAVDGWPDDRAQYHFERTSTGVSAADRVEDTALPPDLEAEIDQLGLSGTGNVQPVPS